MGWDNDEEKWVQNIPTRWAIALISQKLPAAAKATCLVWQIGPTSFLWVKGWHWDSNHTKIKCKVTLDHRKNLMTNTHAHCDIYFQETKFHTMDSKIIFSVVLHYGSNVCLCGTNMKLALRCFETLKKLWTVLENKILMCWTSSVKIFKTPGSYSSRLLPLNPECQIQCSFQM